MPHLCSLAAGIDLAIEGDSEFVDTVRQILPRLYLEGAGPAGPHIWPLLLERMVEPCDIPGQLAFTEEGVCRVRSRDLHGFGMLLQTAIAKILRRAGLLQIHAAALCPPEGAAAALFAGPSGAGKSTLALNLARRGWRFLSDDSVALRDSNGALTALPLRPDFRIVREGDARKELIDPERAFPNQRLTSAVLGSLVFVEQSGDWDSRLVPLQKEGAFARLPASVPEFGSGDGARWQLGFIARLSSLPAFTLSAGRDILSGGAALERLLRALPIGGPDS
ncbi:MAG: hypothetical protein K1Y01_14105 [Vicinamibacteria bacterium]|nr:hypothetical protein [Vicinamibacteria bacterium]